MKKLLLLLLFIPLVSFGQISISDIIKVGKMDLESFEIYALEKGFRHNKIDKTEDSFYGLEMKKSDGIRTEYLTNYQKYGISNRRAAIYQGPIQERLVSIYKELKSLGYEMHGMSESESNGKTYFGKEYIKNGYETIYILISHDDLTVEINYQYFL